MVTTAELTTTAPAPATLVGQATAVEQARAIAEVQAAVTVAQRCPRDVVRALNEMRTACGRMAIASKAFYAVPNRGNGKSVHLARELARIWGNIDYGVRELRRDDDGGVSEVLAFAWDQQTNVRSSRSFIVPHQRMKRVDGKQTRETLIDLGDIYLNNQNVGARAVRECIFTVLPDDFVDEAADVCRGTIEKGDGKPIDERIATVIERFAELGVAREQIEARIGRQRGSWNAADLADLHVIYSSIKRGEARTIDEFPAAPRTVTTADLTEPAASANSKPKRGKAPEVNAEATFFAEPATDGAESWPEVPEIPGASK